MQFKLLLIILLFFVKINFNFGQKSQIDCYILFSQVDKLLAEKDTLAALRLYEAINMDSFIVKRGRYNQMSTVYYKRGLLEQSKLQMRKAVEVGQMGIFYFRDDVDEFETFIEERYGAQFSKEMQVINQKRIEEVIEDNRRLVDDLKEIYDLDQELRRNKIYRTCKSYEFGYRLGLPYDTTQNHQEMLACTKEFRDKDSVVLQRFVDIIDSIGFVPGSDMIFETVRLNTLVNHTGHFRFKNIDAIYLASVKRGTLTPEVYAWYQGYHEEYFKKEHQFYFTHLETVFENLNAEEINQINQKRLILGLPLCPNVVWNTKVY